MASPAVLPQMLAIRLQMSGDQRSIFFVNRATALLMRMDNPATSKTAAQLFGLPEDGFDLVGVAVSTDGKRVYSVSRSARLARKIGRAHV